MYLNKAHLKDSPDALNVCIYWLMRCVSCNLNYIQLCNQANCETIHVTLFLESRRKLEELHLGQRLS